MEGTIGQRPEVVIIGGGPAGAAAARLLSRWGHRVLLLCRSEPSRPSLAESLPPSTQKLLAQVEVLDAIDSAGFYRSTGNTVWWESTDPRIEPFPRGATGYQVQRERFDGVLVSLAERAGVDVRRDASVRAVHVGVGSSDLARVEFDAPAGLRSVVAPWVLDCSGRSGLVARSLGLRRGERGHRTLALVRPWRREGGWDVTDETHTLVESYGDGWAWSVPVSPTVRHVAVMVDPRDGVTALAPEREAEAMYRAELRKTEQLRRLTDGAAAAGPVAAHDASLYDAARACDAGFLLVGDAYSFIDPLSSVGVKKALASAWLAAVAVHTALATPSMQSAALELFETREREVYASYRRLTATQFGRATRRYDHRFWSDRAVVGGVDESDPAANAQHESSLPAVAAALDELKKRSAIHLVRSGRWDVAPRPAVRDREVVLEHRLVTPRDPAGLRFLYGVDLVSLGTMTSAHEQVPDLFEAYNRLHAAVGLPEFLSALATLVAEGLLENRSDSTV
jgi:flavin-dependent dehydrogenase